VTPEYKSSGCGSAHTSQSERCSLAEAREILGISKATFCRKYRSTKKPEEFLHWATQFDIRVGLNGDITCCRAHVLEHREALRQAALGRLSTGPSERALRLGAYSQPGGGRRLANRTRAPAHGREDG
jgi:hypothetical protein